MDAGASRKNSARTQVASRDLAPHRLRLVLKPEQRLEHLASGIDFLGYIVFPQHTLVRRRVVVHAREKLDAWRRRHLRGRRIAASRPELEELRSICASYAGHFSHANTWRLRATFRRRYYWLQSILRATRYMRADVRFVERVP